MGRGGVWFSCLVYVRFLVRIRSSEATMQTVADHAGSVLLYAVCAGCGYAPLQELSPRIRCLRPTEPPDVAATSVQRCREEKPGCREDNSGAFSGLTGRKEGLPF